MSYVSEQGVLNSQYNTEIIRCLPHVLMRPQLIQDGSAWLAIYGDLPTGVVGTGQTPAAAMADFDEAWTRPAVSPPGYPNSSKPDGDSTAALVERAACIQICEDEYEKRINSDYPAERVHDFVVVARAIQKAIRNRSLPT